MRFQSALHWSRSLMLCFKYTYLYESAWDGTSDLSAKRPESILKFLLFNKSRAELGLWPWLYLSNKNSLASNPISNFLRASLESIEWLCFCLNLITRWSLSILIEALNPHARDFLLLDFFLFFFLLPNFKITLKEILLRNPV